VGERADHGQTRLKDLMARRGRKVYVLADSSTLAMRPFPAWARFALPWTPVTDDGADPGRVQKFRDAGYRVGRPPFLAKSRWVGYFHNERNP
jgi:hypothetical protein